MTAPWLTPRISTAWLALLLPLATASCAGLERSGQGAVPPQPGNGECQVKKFFVVNFTAVPTDMTVSSAGQGCTFTVFNPDLQLVTTAALVTSPPAHGQAAAGLVLAGRQAAVSYRPQPGYTGPDHFTVTLEPVDRAIAVNVMVQPPQG